MKDQIMNDINKNEFTEKKPIIDLLALWEEVEDMISERRAIEGGNNNDYELQRVYGIRNAELLQGR